MVKYLKEFALAVLAGMAISIGCIVYLSVENAVAGSILFSVGLLTVLAFGLNLFTGKSPYIVKNPPSYVLFTLLVWLGNFVGTGISAALVHFTRVNGKMIEKCASIAQTKADDSLISLFILAFFCGIMMFIAVDTFNNQGEKKIFPHRLLWCSA